MDKKQIKTDFKINNLYYKPDQALKKYKLTSKNEKQRGVSLN